MAVERNTAATDLQALSSHELERALGRAAAALAALAGLDVRPRLSRTLSVHGPAAGSAAPHPSRIAVRRLFACRENRECRRSPFVCCPAWQRVSGLGPPPLAPCCGSGCQGRSANA